jgi:ribosome-associated heat shock protein Hsp15
MFPGMSRITEREDTRPEPVRIDKWLWAARFFKTRAIAADAVTGGKVEMGGDRVKPAKLLRVGDEVRIRIGPYLHVVIVRGLSERRGPAAQAQKLYEETEQSRKEREHLAWQLKHAAQKFDEGEGRPTKRDRRDLDRARGR